MIYLSNFLNSFILFDSSLFIYAVKLASIIFLFSISYAVLSFQFKILKFFLIYVWAFANLFEFMPFTVLTLGKFNFFTISFKLIRFFSFIFFKTNCTSNGVGNDVFLCISWKSRYFNVLLFFNEIFYWFKSAKIFTFSFNGYYFLSSKQSLSN